MSTPKKYVDLVEEMLGKTSCAHCEGTGKTEQHDAMWKCRHCSGCGYTMFGEMSAPAMAAALHEAAKDAVRGCLDVAEHDACEGGPFVIDTAMQVRTTVEWNGEYDTESEAIAAREKLVEELTR